MYNYDDEKIKCPLCGNNFHKLTVHIKKTHNFKNIEDFILLYPNQKIKSDYIIRKEKEGSILGALKCNKIKLENESNYYLNPKRCLGCNGIIKYDNTRNDYCSKKCGYKNYKRENKIKYNWAEIQEYYNEGHTIRECQDKFGGCFNTYNHAVKKGVFKTRDLQSAITLSENNGARSKIDRSNVSDEVRMKQSVNAYRNGLGGQTNYKKCSYNNIWFDSKWEVKIAKLLDKMNIKWVRDKKYMFIWYDSQLVRHRYYPDFYLPDYDVYLEPKNKYLMKKDIYKLEEVKEMYNINLIYGELNSIVKYIKNTGSHVPGGGSPLHG